jgi:UDP-N-acetylglucosamine:LPS N-acetylglucosamine transferase
MPTRAVVAAIDMGYGHLRPAAALASYLSAEVLQMDHPPLGDEKDRRFWESTRDLYEPLTRLSQLPGVGGPMRALLNTITAIPTPWPVRDLSAPTQGTKWMLRAAREGVGRKLSEYLKESGLPLVTTFYAAAILAELHGASGLHCVITDSDVNRVWAPPDPAASRIVYFAPSERARRRMLTYGVRPERVVTTGYPLPDELGSEAAVKRNLAARLSRLRASGQVRREAEAELGPLPEAREPPLVVFAIGGAGAQVPLAEKIVRGMREKIKKNFFRLALVAGRRPEVGQALREAVDKHGLDVEVLEDANVFNYIRRFNELLARADALWSKPSEMTFFAALGLPFIAAPSVGVHESWNLRWASDFGAALAQHDPSVAGDWLAEWLEDGMLASAAWAGYTRLPRRGLYRIAEEVAQHDQKPGRLLDEREVP